MNESTTSTHEARAPRRRRWPLRVALALVMLIAVLALTAWRVLESETALQWAVARALQAAGPDRLAIDGLSGTLLRGLHARHVRWRDDPATPGVSVEAAEVDVNLSLRGLLARRLVLGPLAAQSVLIDFAPGKDEKSAPPRSLALPIELAVGDARVARLEVRRASQRYVLSNVGLDYQGGVAGHNLERAEAVLDEVAWNDKDGQTGIGTALALQGHINASPPFELAATLNAKGGQWKPLPAEPMQAALKAGGSLQAPRLEVAVSGVLGASLNAEATLAPFSPHWLDRAELRARSLDLARLGKALGQTLPDSVLDAQLLDLRLDDKARAMSGNARLANARPGAAAEGRIPVAAAQAAFTLGMPGELRLADLRADLAPAGQVSGSAQWSPDGKQGSIEAALALSGVSLKSISSQLRDLRWSGKVLASSRDHVQQASVDLSGTGWPEGQSAAAGSLHVSGQANLAGSALRLSQAHVSLGTGQADLSGELQLAGERPFKAGARLSGIDPAVLGNFPAGRLNATLDAQGRLAAKPSNNWRATVQAQFSDSRLFDMPLSGRVQADVDARGAQHLDAALRLGANSLNAAGTLAWAPGVDNRLTLRASVPDLQMLDKRLSGSADLDGELRGTFQAPGGRLALRSKSLGASLGTRPLRLANATIAATLDAASGATRASPAMLAALRVEGSELAVGTLTWSQPRVALEARRTGAAQGLAAAIRDEWAGTLTALQAGGQWPMRLASPANFRLGAAGTEGQRTLSVSAAEFNIVGGRAQIAELDWGPGVLRTRGQLTAVPVAPFLALVQSPFAADSTLKLSGQWRFDNLLSGTVGSGADVQVQRESGDLLLGTDKRPLGLSDLGVTARGQGGGAIALDLHLASALLGSVAASGSATPPGGVISPEALRDTVVSITARLDLPDLRAIAPLVGDFADFGGRAHAEFRLDGTLAAPRLTGDLSADALRVTAPAQGLDLRNGSLRAALEGRTLVLQSFSMAGPAGRLSATGRLPLPEFGPGGASALSGELSWKAEGLRLLDRPGQRAQITGEGSISFENVGDVANAPSPLLTVKGRLRVDEAELNFDRGERAHLGDDVHVAGTPPRSNETAGRLPRIAVDLDLQAGDGVAVSGAGLDARLAGEVRLAGRADVALLAHGRLRVTQGSYLLAGQKLSIERGELIFDGPLDNPALDILVLRKNLPVEAGAQISGTARVPTLQLVSTPPVTDSEKIAWIVLGRGLDTAGGGADLGLLQAAASLVGNSKAPPLTQRIASNVGLDDISFRSTEAGQNALALGKRLSDRIYMEVEQGLAVASTILRLNFVLTRTLTARLEAGTTSGVGSGGVGLYYSRSFQ
jgi:translocation and assembly module TamB